MQQQSDTLSMFLRSNLFAIFGMIGALITLWGATQTLPLKSEIELNKQAILGLVSQVQANEKKQDSFASTERVNALTVQLESVNKNLGDKIDLVNRNLDDRLGRLERKIDSLK